MDMASLGGLFSGLFGGGGQAGMYSSQPIGGGFGESVGNPLAGAFGGGPASGLSIANGQMPANFMPEAGAYGMYQATPDSSVPFDMSALKGIGALGALGGGVGRSASAQAPMMGGGGGGNTQGLFSSLMLNAQPRQVNPTAGRLNILG